VPNCCLMRISSEEEAIHGRDYDNRTGLGEACFSGARGRCGGCRGSAQAVAARPGGFVLVGIVMLKNWTLSPLAQIFIECARAMQSS
jgi:hypothetical protein